MLPTSTIGADAGDCISPAALGGTGTLDPIFPTAPFTPGTTWANALQTIGLALPAAPTNWLELPGSYSAQCSNAGGANVFQIAPLAGAPALSPSPDPT